ncbi:MAG: DUF2442 domain-containing protein [Campylobacterota bacterium]|nr:DUF2442 domain-containing protein [Campylobacterota bacterium]
MINLVKVTYVNEYNLELSFSDNSHGIIDFSYLLNKNSILTNQLKDIQYFKNNFIDFGALCWKNGLEFSAESLNRKLIESNKLSIESEVA